MNGIDLLKILFGSQRALADALGVGESAVSNWRRHGIPHGQKWRILEITRAQGMAIEPEDPGPPAASRSVEKMGRVRPVSSHE